MGNTALLKVTTTPTMILEASGEVTVRTLSLSNISDTSSAVDVEFRRGSTSHSILSSHGVPGKKTLSVFLSKDIDVYLESGDSLWISAEHDNKIEAMVAYEGSAGSDSSSSSSGSSSTSGSSSSSLGSSSSATGSSSSTATPSVCNGEISSYLGLPNAGAWDPSYPPYCYETYGCRGNGLEFIIYTKGQVVGQTSGVSFQGVQRTRLGSAQVINGTLEILGTSTNGDRQPFTLQLRPVDSGGYPVYPNWVDDELVTITNVETDRTGYLWENFNKTYRIQINTVTLAPGDTRSYYYLDCVS